MINYKWIFSAFDCKVSEDGMQNVITTVHWRYNGTNENGVSAEVYGVQAVGAPTPEAFIPYPDLSEEQLSTVADELQDVIKKNTGQLYGEPSISAAIRNLSKQPARVKYGLPAFGEVYEKKLRTSGKGYKYKLIGEKNG